VYGYYRHAYPDQMVGKVGRYYQSMGGIPQRPLHRARYRLFREFLEASGCRVAGARAAPPPRLSAARAGTTTYGKNCFAFADRSGSFITISTFLVDVELDCDAPTLKVACPEKCTLCIDACPTGALYQSLKMDPRRCIARNSYATEQPVTPMELRRGMGNWVFGCDVCQDVCPRNRARLKLKLPPSAYLEMLAGDFELEGLLAMTDQSFRRVQPLLNYITEKRLFQRNAAVALGNRGDPASVPALERAMDDPEEIVRGHAAWALGEIGGAPARQALEKRLSTEPTGYVRDEIGAALG
ncbi:MAG: HEAT repeat domain-containing protein, partial [Dehalococcoidales bacterium]